MTAPIVSHGLRAIVPFFLLSEARDRAVATIARQHAEALPKVEGQLWQRIAEGHIRGENYPVRLAELHADREADSV